MKNLDRIKNFQTVPFDLFLAENICGCFSTKGIVFLIWIWHLQKQGQTLDSKSKLRLYIKFLRPVQAVYQPRVEEIVQVEKDVGVLVHGVQLQLEAGDDVEDHDPQHVVDEPGAEVEGVGFTAAPVSLNETKIGRKN